MPLTAPEVTTEDMTMFFLYAALLENPEDESAFLEIYHTHLPILTRTGQRYFLEKSFVEDALQLTWESVAIRFTKISSLPRHEITPYLVTIMMGNIVKYVNRDL